MPVDFVCASAINAWLPGANEKAWGELIAAGSSGKTELLSAFNDGERRAIFREHFTENSFTSAFRDENDPDEDHSLARLLQYSTEPRGPKILVLPEMTTIYKARPEKRDTILSNLRAAYDGSLRQQAGNIGADLKTDLVFGLIGACTETADVFRMQDQTLGSRTLICRLARHTLSYASGQKTADFVSQVDRLDKADLRNEIKGDVKEALARCIELIRTTEGRVQRDGKMAHQVGRLALLSTRVRSVPLSDRMYASTPEGPARLEHQLMGWGDSRAVFDGRTAWTEEDYRLIRRVAQDTMPPHFLRVWKALWRGSAEASIQGLSTDKIIAESKTDRDICRQLRQWSIFELLNDFEGGSSWGIRPDVAADIEYTGFLENL